MATANDIITAAYRESQVTAIVSAPNTNELNEALPLLNSIIQSTIGYEAGEELHDLNIGGQFDQASYCAQWVPENVRLLFNLSGPLTLKLHPQPYEGQRIALVDVPGNFSTNNLTLDANGRTIELDTTETFDTDGFYGEWLYRADIADWSRITDLDFTDDMPFPTEFDSYFIVRLAMRLNPRNTVLTTKETLDELERIERKIRARYRRRRPRQDMPHRLLGERRGYGLSTADFNAGRTWR